jgi:phospholipase D1/2
MFGHVSAADIKDDPPAGTQQVYQSEAQVGEQTAGNDVEELTDHNLSGRHVNFVTSKSYPSVTRNSPDSPSARTGPPRSLSYRFSLLHSRSTSHDNVEGLDSDQGSQFPFASASGDFRSALDLTKLDHDRKGKKRATVLSEDSWHWTDGLHDSPKEEKEGFNFKTGVEAKNDKQDEHELNTDKTTPDVRGSSSTRPLPSRTRLSSYIPHMSRERIRTGASKWAKLRALLSTAKRQGLATPGPSVVTSHTVNITDELITGGLSALMLRLWFERDEKGHRRVPVLLHRLRIRVSDSLHPLHGHKSVFRIECEYANGAARWVIYRQLRDFLSLHAHYAFSNAYNHNVNKLPDFPRTSACVMSSIEFYGSYDRPRQVYRTSSF